MAEEERKHTTNQSQGEQEEGHVRLENLATSLGIPREMWGNPEVAQYLQLLKRAEDLQIDMNLASLNANNQPVGETPSLAARFSSAELLLRAASFILQDGFNQTEPIATTPHQRGYLQGKGNAALRQYGLEVVEKPTEKSRAADDVWYKNAMEALHQARQQGVLGKPQTPTSPQPPEKSKDVS